MIKADENGVQVEGNGESIILEWTSLTISIAKLLTEQLTHDEKDILNKMFQTASFGLLQKNNEVKIGDKKDV